VFLVDPEKDHKNDTQTTLTIMNFQAFQSKDKNYATTIIKDGRITALVQKVLTAAPSLPSAPGLPGSPC